MSDNPGGDAADPTPSADRSELTREQLAAWGALYDTGPRQIRRYSDIGIAAGDPCPLSDPTLMPAWWARRMSHRCPDRILAAARNAARSSPPPGAPSEPPPSSAGPIPPGAPSPPAPVSDYTPVNLSDYELGEGQAVVNQRRIVSAVYAKLERSYAGTGADCDLIQSQYNRAVESLRRLEKDDRQDRQLRGLLIPRAAMQRDLDTAAELLRQMRDSMVRRVLERCTSLPAEHRAAVSQAILTVRAQEDRVFRQLKSLKHVNDVLAELAA